MADLNVSNVGKNQVHLRSLKPGLKEEDLKTDKEKSIFKSIDKDGNGVLDADELKQFAASMDKSNDDIATKKEAKAYIKENDLKGVKKKDVLKFLKNNNINTDDVKNTQVIEQDGQKLVQVEYNDGRKETIKPDRATDVTQTDAEGNTVTESRDKDKNLTQKTTVATNGDKTTVDYETTVDANGNPVPKKETSVTEKGDKTTETNYEAGKKVETTETVRTDGSTTVIKYDDKENPESATKTQGLNESQYTYVNGDQRETSRVENKGRDDQRTTNFTYDDENGTVTSVATEASVNGQKTTTTVKKDGEKLSETIVDGDKTTTTTKNAEGDGYTQVIQDGDNSTTNQLNNEGHRLTSTKVVDGKEYTLNYDGQGNTTGIIVQNGESPASIARKFGCSEEKLKAANQDVLGGKKYFDVGSEIKVPRELEADDKALQGRKSSQEAKAEFARDEQIRAQKRAEAKARKAEAAARDKALRQDLGLINYKGAGTKVQGDFYKNGKKTHTKTFTKIGNATHGRTICQDKSGKIYVVAHNGVVLKDTWVNVSAHRDVQAVGNRRVAVEKGARDGHGRKTVYDGDGNTHVMSHDNKILKKEYVARSDKSDAIRKNSKTAQQATVEMLDSQLAAAKENFNEQMKQDGWAGDFADGVSKIWNNDLFGGGTGNTADQVRQDFKTYQNNINQLKAAAKQGDGAFKAKFKQIYGIDYNQKAIAAYNMNPTEANYRKAFGTKNNIGERVAKYNASQQLGSTVVKTGVEVAVAGSAIAAADALEVVTFGASTPVSMAITSAATFASDVVVEGSDRLNITGEYRDADGNIVKTDGAFKEGTDAGAILEDAGKDALIAGATFGLGKFANSAYKVGKAAYATSKVASKAATVGEKAVATVAKAETGVSKVATTATKAETGVARATTTATHAETGVSKVATTATKTETGVSKIATTATKAETGIARTTTTATHTETGVAKVETGVAKAETVAQKAETTATKAEDAASKAGEAVQDAAGAGAKTSHIAERVIDTTADVAVGATAEYIETGDVTLEGTAMNAAVGSIGIAGEKLGGKLKSSAKFQQVKEGVSDAYHNAKEKVSDGVSGAYQKAKDGVSGAYNTAKQKASDAADSMKEKFSQRKATNADGAGSSQRAQGNESANRANESSSSQRTQGNESADRANESGSSQRTQGNDSANGTNETGSSQKAEGQVRPMSEAEINERISNLEPKLQDSKVANDIKNEYADFLNGSITDPAEFKKQFRKLSLKAHPDKTGGDATLFQEISNVRDCVNSGDQRKINEAYAKLNQVVNEKASNLSKYEKEMGSLKAQANANNGAKVNEQAKAQEAPKSGATDKAQANANNGAKVNEQAKAQEAPKSGAADKAQANANNGAKVNEQAKAQEAPKADSAEKAQAKTDNSAKAEQQGPTISAEDKLAMGQMGNQIHSAKNLSDLDKLQAQLDKMPDCAQKRNLQKQIDSAKKSQWINNEIVTMSPKELYVNIKDNENITNVRKISYNGNGAIAFDANGVHYQVHYEGGKTTAIRMENNGKKSYYAVGENGKMQEIDRNTFIQYKNSADRAFKQAVDDLNAPNAAQIFNDNVATMSPKELNNYIKNNESVTDISNIYYNGNGAVAFDTNGVHYQVHYEGGKPTAIRMENNGKKSYYAVGENGKMQEIDRNTFIQHKNSADKAFKQAVDDLNAPKGKAGLADDIKSTFSENTQQNLSKLKNGQSVTLKKGNKRYVVKNNNGQITIESVEIISSSQKAKAAKKSNDNLNNDNRYENKNDYEYDYNNGYNPANDPAMYDQNIYEDNFMNNDDIFGNDDMGFDMF